MFFRNRFCFFYSRTALLCLILMHFMFQQLNNDAQALSNICAQVRCAKLLFWFITSRSLSKCFQRLAPLYQMLWVLEVHKETTYPGKFCNTRFVS